MNRITTSSTLKMMRAMTGKPKWNMKNSTRRTKWKAKIWKVTKKMKEMKWRAKERRKTKVERRWTSSSSK